MGIKHYWKRSKQNMEWNIAYRKIGNSSIIDNKSIPFKVLSTPKNTWAADPFLIEHKDNIYLFYELFEKKKNKGVIAYSVLCEDGFSEPKTIIDEPFHLSFPCVFKHNDSYYMIPESGLQKSIFMYKCDVFPDKWHKECTLLTNINSSDSIVFEHKNEKYLLASILQSGTGNAKNAIYRIDFEKKSSEFYSDIDGCGENGYRNAGYLFNSGDMTFRPGQNCCQGEYGKSLYFYKVLSYFEPKYSEQFYTEITVNDISVKNAVQEYCGIHTYSIAGEYDVVDLKYFTKNSIIKRIFNMIKLPFKYLKVHFFN